MGFKRPEVRLLSLGPNKNARFLSLEKPGVFVYFSHVLSLTEVGAF